MIYLTKGLSQVRQDNDFMSDVERSRGGGKEERGSWVGE